MIPAPERTDRPVLNASERARALSPRRRALAFVVVALAFVMDLLDVTIVNVALPSIQQGLSMDGATLPWSVAGYALAFAVLLVTGGRLGDSVGYRTMFLAGVAGFTLASLLCGLSMTPGQLVAARMLQGATAACMVPQVMALMQVMYPPAERFRLFAVFGMLGGASAALGPVVGGLLIDANVADLGWRAVFLINLPVGAFSLWAGWILLPRGRGAAPKQLDLAGTVRLTLTATALMLPLIQGPESGWPVWCFLCLAAVVPLAVWTRSGLVRREARDGCALVSPALFSLKSVRWGLGTSLALNGVVPAYLLALTLVLQGGLKVGPSQLALLCLPIALGAAFSIAVLSQRLVPRIGSKTIVLGAWVQAAGIGLALLALRSHFSEGGYQVSDERLLVANGLMGIGIGLIGPALTTVSLQEVPLAEAGSASGVVSAVQQLAVALALASAGGLMLHASPGPAGAATWLAGLERVALLLLGLLALGSLMSKPLRILVRPR